MAASLGDDDVAAAITTLWPTINGMAAACPGGLTRGRVAARPSQPYAELTVKQGPTAPGLGYMAPAFTRGVPYIDWRHVTISVYGKKADVSAVMVLVLGTCDSLGKNLAVPNTTATLGVKKMPDGIAQDPVKRDGEDIWCGTAEYEVCTQRAWP